MRRLIKLCLLAITALSCTAWGNEVDALQMLKNVAPAIVWDAKSVVEVDIDCDKNKDYVFLSQTDGKATIGIVLGRYTDPKVYLTDVTLKNKKQETCDGSISLFAESLDYNPWFTVGQTPDGFKRSTCLAFRVSRNKCEPFHFFWHAEQNRPAWWREK